MTQIEELVKRARANIAELEKEFSESENRYNKAIEEGAMKIMEAETERDEFRAKLERVVEALTPSADTKAAYMSEFNFSKTITLEDGQEWSEPCVVPWTTIKEIMKAIMDRATTDAPAQPSPLSDEAVEAAQKALSSWEWKPALPVVRAAIIAAFEVERRRTNEIPYFGA